MLLQLSRWHLPAERSEEVQRVLQDAGEGSRQDLRALSGLLAFYAGHELTSNTFVNVSVWDSLAHAQQMSGSKAVQTHLREPLASAGATFDLFGHYPVAWKLGDAASEAGRTAAKAVRISKGSFAKERAGDVDTLMRRSEKELAPAIERLPGLVGYYVGTDADTGTVTHISFWDSVEHAAQMSTLKEMLILREPAVALGIQFEPQINYPVVWST